MNAKILTLQSLYYESVCNLTYDVNKNTAPDNILKLFSRISTVHTYNTRASTSEHFYTKEFRVDVNRNAFSRVGVQIWNEMPQTEDSYNQCRYDYCENEKVILLSFIFIIYYFYNSLINFPCIQVEWSLV